jgi:hypothetical protein
MKAGFKKRYFDGMAVRVFGGQAKSVWAKA